MTGVALVARQRRDRGQPQKSGKPHQGALGVTGTDLIHRLAVQAGLHLIHRRREGLDKSLRVKILGTRRIPTTVEQVESEEECLLDDLKLRVTVAIGPAEMLHIAPQESGVDGGQATVGQQFAATTAEDEHPLVFANQPRQFGHQPGAVQLVKILLLVDATVTGAVAIPLLPQKFQRRLTAKFLRQIAPDGRLQPLLADGLGQQGEEGQDRRGGGDLQHGRKGDQLRRIEREIEGLIHLFR